MDEEQLIENVEQKTNKFGECPILDEMEPDAAGHYFIDIFGFNSFDTQNFRNEEY